MDSRGSSCENQLDARGQDVWRGGGVRQDGGLKSLAFDGEEEFVRQVVGGVVARRELGLQQRQPCEHAFEACDGVVAGELGLVAKGCRVPFRFDAERARRGGDALVDEVPQRFGRRAAVVGDQFGEVVVRVVALLAVLRPLSAPRRHRQRTEGYQKEREIGRAHV